MRDGIVPWCPDCDTEEVILLSSDKGFEFFCSCCRQGIHKPQQSRWLCPECGEDEVAIDRTGRLVCHMCDTVLE